MPIPEFSSGLMCCENFICSISITDKKNGETLAIFFPRGTFSMSIQTAGNDAKQTGFCIVIRESDLVVFISLGIPNSYFLWFFVLLKIKSDISSC